LKKKFGILQNQHGKKIMFQQGTAVCHFRETVSEETHTVGGMAAFGVAEFLCSMRINSALSLSLR
jgi:hypothetical protein